MKINIVFSSWVLQSKLEKANHIEAITTLTHRVITIAPGGRRVICMSYNKNMSTL